MTTFLALSVTVHLLLEPQLHPNGGGEAVHLAGYLDPGDAPVFKHRDVGVVVRLLHGPPAARAGHAVGGTPCPAARLGHRAAAHLAEVEHPAEVLLGLALPADRR